MPTEIVITTLALLCAMVLSALKEGMDPGSIYTFVVNSMLFAIVAVVAFLAGISFGIEIANSKPPEESPEPPSEPPSE